MSTAGLSPWRGSFPDPFAQVEYLPTEKRALPANWVPVHPDPRLGPESDPTVAVFREPENNAFWFIYTDGCEFCLSAAGDTVRAYRPPGMSDEDLNVYLYGPILGFSLRLQVVVSLHASAVVLGGRAVAFVGTGGAGKSTLAARFALGGIPVVTDDVLPLAESASTFQVWCPVPQIKLWPESVVQLYGRADALPKLVPSNRSWNKRHLDQSQPNVAFVEGRPLLGTVYLLQPRTEAPEAPRSVAVPPAEALMALTAESYVNYALSRDMRAHEFGVLSRLVQTVPVRRLVLPETFTELAVLIQFLEGDSAQSAR